MKLRTERDSTILSRPSFSTLFEHAIPTLARGIVTLHTANCTKRSGGERVAFEAVATTVVGCPFCGTTRIVLVLGDSVSVIREREREAKEAISALTNAGDDNIHEVKYRIQRQRELYDNSWSFLGRSDADHLAEELGGLLKRRYGTQDTSENTEESSVAEKLHQWRDDVIAELRAESDAALKVALGTTLGGRVLLAVHQSAFSAYYYTDHFANAEVLAHHEDANYPLVLLRISESDYTDLQSSAARRVSLGQRNRAAQSAESSWWGVIGADYADTLHDSVLWKLVSSLAESFPDGGDALETILDTARGIQHGSRS